MRGFNISIMVFISFVYTVQGQEYCASVKNISLASAIENIETNHKMSCSFSNEMIEEITISYREKKYSLQAILEEVFNQTYLDYEILDSRHILVSKREKQSSSLTHLCGYVQDIETKEPIAFASVYTVDLSAGVETDKNGYFQIKINSSNKNIIISFLGYKSYDIQTDITIDDFCETYYLQTENHSLQPIVLQEYLSDGIGQSLDANTILIHPEEMDVLPGSVDQDIMAAIRFLPGVNSPSNSLDDINVRGGTQDQNLILYDGIPLYHTSHFFGSISAFNPFIIDRVDVHRSGISSEFGGRVSSVIDIHSVDKIAKKLSGNFGINMTHLYMNLDIPLWKNASIVLSTRRSITEAWNSPTFVKYAEKIFQGTRLKELKDDFKFSDANFKWLWNIGKNKFSMSILGALNDLNYEARIPDFDAFSVDLLNLYNQGSSFLWERQWSKTFDSKLTITNSIYSYNYNLSFQKVGVEEEAPISFDSKNRITDSGFHWVNNWKIKPGQKVKFGFQFTENNIDINLKTRNRNDKTSTSEKFLNKINSIFSEYSIDLLEVLHLDIGLRYQYSVEIKNNYFEPRIALATDVTDNFKLKFSTNKHFQFISQLVVFDINDLGLTNQIWVASDDKIIPVIESING